MNRNASEGEDTSNDIIKGMIYSTFEELGPKPQVLYPNSLSYDFSHEILMRSTCFLPPDIEKLNDKISVFPFPEYNLLGLTYFYKESSGIQEKSTNAALTILLNEQFSNFVNQNMDNLKENLKDLSIELEKNQSNPQLIFSQYFFTLIDTINRYNSIKILKKQEDTAIVGKTAVLLSYFHVKRGPISFLCYPENRFSEEQQKRISDRLDTNTQQGFFTCTFSDMVAVNHYFEIPSKIARGTIEMCLISFLFDTMPSNKILTNIAFKFSKYLDVLISQPEVYLAFYGSGFDYSDKIEQINQMHEYLRQWLIETYNTFIENES
jgi:hypothetical protein